MKIRRLRWYIAALLFTATVINYIDRQALSIVAPVLTKELGISPIEYSNMLQAFLIAYTLMYLGSGFLVDRWGTRVSQSCFMAWWSISNVLHAFANSAMQLAAFRFLLGVGEPGNFMAAFKAISEWYPPKERAFVNGLVQAGSAVGAIVAAPLVAWIALRYGWRASFVVTGCFGFVWLVGWLLIYRLPEKHPWITPDELLLIQAERPPEVVPLSTDLGIIAGPLCFGSCVVVLSILDAEVSGGATGIHDGRDGDAGVAPLSLGGSGLAQRWTGVRIPDQAQLDDAQRAGCRDAALRAADAVERGDRVHAIVHAGAGIDLHGDVRTHGLEDKPHDDHQRHLPDGRGRLDFGRDRIRQRSRRNAVYEPHRACRGALFLYLDFCGDGFPASGCVCGVQAAGPRADLPQVAKYFQGGD
jgi:MFS family permease